MARNIAALSLSLASDHSIVIDRYVERLPGGSEHFTDKSHFRGHYYSGMPPGGSILLAPIGLIVGPLSELVFRHALSAGTVGADYRSREGIELLLMQLLGTLLVVIPLTAWGWTRLYRYLTRGLGVQDGVSTLAVTAGALCSNLAFYSTYLSGKQIAAMLGLLAFTFAVGPSSNERAPLRLVWAGLLAGLAVATEYTMVLFAVFLFAYVVWVHGWRESLKFVLAGTVWAVILGWYHTAAFGNPLFTSYHFRWADTARTGHVLSPPFARFSLRRLWGMTFSTYKGIFVYTPWYLLVAAGFWRGLRSPEVRREVWMFLGMSAGFLVMLAFSPVWSSGGWGMRYLLPIFPYFTVGLALWLSDVHRSSRGRTLAYTLIFVALAINYLPFGAAESSNVDPLWSAPILYVFRQIVDHGFSLYTVDFVARNIRPLTAAQNVLFHLMIYGAMLVGVALLWRSKWRTTAQSAS